MIIYRGVKDLLFKNINPLYKNEDLTFLDFGKGTSYSYKKELALDYVTTCSNFAWFLSYEYSPKNELYIGKDSLMDDESYNIDDGFFINGNFIERNEISDYANKHSHDCIYFDYDNSDPHLLLLDSAECPVLIEVEFYTNNHKLIKELMNINFKFYDNKFKIPLSRTIEIDNLIEHFIF